MERGKAMTLMKYESNTAATEPLFKVGQVVVLKSKRIPFRIKAMEWNDGWFYAWNSRNFAAESMLAPLTAEEVTK